MRKQNHFFPEAWHTSFFERVRETVGLTLIAIGFFILISIVSYCPTDHSYNTANSQNHFDNFFGQNGAFLADLLLQLLGCGSYIIGPIIFIWSLCYFNKRFPFIQLKQILYLLAAVLCASAVMHTSFLISHHISSYPGIIIGLAIKLIEAVFSYVLSHNIIFLVINIVSTIGFIITFFKSINFSWHKFYYSVSSVATYFKRRPEKEDFIKNKLEPEIELRSSVETSINITSDKSNDIFEYKIDESLDESLDESVDLGRSERIDDSLKQFNKVKVNTSYKLPSIDLLDKQLRQDIQQTVGQKEVEENAARLIQVLLDFGVKGKIIRVRSGPVVTLYEFEPAPGIKSSRIIGLSDDIARSMSALSARIALIPGKTEIGIELPNPKRLMVNLHSLLKHHDFNTVPAALCLALGQNIGGEPVYVDLARMPHMIVAGTTGSGKSVGINTMILSLLYRHTPATCRFIMIDPKMLELSVYNDIPHLLTPVVTDPKKAVAALKWTVKEMENRYRAMSHLGVRNIEGYNQNLLTARKKNEIIKRQVQTGFNPETGRPVFEEHAIDMTPLPYIVVIVDEMADLMMVAGKDIEITVQRLAQMARAAGIHVIMATQRPSVDVITGTIKANFPTRISFQVTSKFDSKTILGEQGAEQLLGRGDMLLMEAGGKIQRVHGPFVSDQEVEAIVIACKLQGRPDYIDTITQESDDFGIVGFGNADAPQDDLYQRAIDIVRTDKKASTSYIQRKLEIGYNKAATIIERMEADGIISSANHVGKRQVLI